jgi:hypothetical protein
LAVSTGGTWVDASDSVTASKRLRAEESEFGIF